MNKLIVLLGFILISSQGLAYGGSLQCQFTRNVSQKFPIVETTVEVDEEENSEFYFGRIANEIDVSIDYMPFQEGITIVITDLNSGAKMRSTGMKETALGYTNAYARYRVGCFVKE